MINVAFDGIATQTLVSSLIELILIFIVCLLGAYVKDVYSKIVTRNVYKIRLSRILISTVVSSIVMYSLSSIMIPKLGLKLCLLPWFISGTIGFQAMGKISKINFWIKYARAVLDNRSAIQNLIETAIDDRDDDPHNGDDHTNQSNGSSIATNDNTANRLADNENTNE